MIGIASAKRRLLLGIDGICAECARGNSMSEGHGCAKAALGLVAYSILGPIKAQYMESPRVTY